MAKLPSANWSKASYQTTKRLAIPQLLPRQGTVLRLLYNELMAHKGQWVDLAPILSLYRKPKTRPHPTIGPPIERLRNFYGLDILTRGMFQKGRCTSGNWACLVGEWKGLDYVDYTDGNVPTMP